MKKLKVVFISNWFDNPYQQLLTKHLNYRNVQVEEYFWSVIFLHKIIMQGKPNILHLHTLHSFITARNKIYSWVKFFLFISQLLILRLFSVKVVWTVHEWADKICGGKHDISPVMSRIIGKFLHAIITHCDTTKHEIAEALSLKNKDKIFVVPHGNYISYYENKISIREARKALDIPAESFVFLLFGGIHRSKGILEAIDAFKHLQQDEVYLLIAGKSGDSQLEELIIDEIKEFNKILFVPKQIPDEQVQICMNACDSVLLPYIIFTTSGVAVLAMSYGRACIAPQQGFFKDILDNSGAFLYDPNRKDSLLDAMRCAVEKKNNILDMGRHNLKLSEKWSWDYVSEKTLEIYQSCLNN